MVVESTGKLVGICVPTVREDQIRIFIKSWLPYWRRSALRDIRVILFVHEDTANPTFDISLDQDLEIHHTSHREIDQVLGDQGWIIPRRSGSSRSFPMYLAWKAGCDFILTLDDDCLPDVSPETFISDHISAFNQERWFNTISGEIPRGVPYRNRGTLPVLLNHGLWTGNPDLDGPSSVLKIRNGCSVVLRANREVIPPGMWFPLCAMNVCYHRDAIPAAYNLLMGVEKYGFDRFDDIWSGLFLKRIADHLGQYVTNGLPFIYHQKASDPFVNMQKEALGLKLHEYFWQHVELSSLDGARTISESYSRLAEWVFKFPEKYPVAGAPNGYFEKLSRAMLCWLELFSNN